jgi:hypothetical protein
LGKSFNKERIMKTLAVVAALVVAAVAFGYINLTPKTDALLQSGKEVGKKAAVLAADALNEAAK